MKASIEGRHYGWVVVAIAMVALMLAIGTTMHAYGLYVVPAGNDFGLPRAAVNTGLILVNVGAAVAALVVGQLIDRFSARLAMLVGGLVLAASLVTLGLSRSVWMSAAVLSFPVGFAIASMGTLTAPALVAQWFTRHRARAMAITMMGISGGTVFVVPVIAWIIEGFGWRQSLIFSGAVVGVVLPLLAWLARLPSAAGIASDEAEGVALKDVAADAAATAQRPMQILAQRRVWGIAIGTAVAMAALQAIAVSIAPIALDMGFTTTRSASLISALGGAGIVGKLIVASVGDRIDRFDALAGMFAMVAAACCVLIFAQGYELLLAGSMLIGFAAGATIPLYLALVADEFGAQTFGTVNGLITFTISVLSAGAVRLSGEIFDRTGRYDQLFHVLFVAALIAGALMVVTGRRWSARSREVGPVPAV